MVIKSPAAFIEQTLEVIWRSNNIAITIKQLNLFMAYPELGAICNRKKSL